MTTAHPKTTTALITTLWYLPALLWQMMFIAMYLQEERHPDYFEPLTLAIFTAMVGITFLIALGSERINEKRFQYSLTVIFLTLLVVLIFDKNVYAQLGFFLLYSSVFAYPLKDFIKGFSSPPQKEPQPMPKLETFHDLLKRGNLPGDDRHVPNWMKIKNDQLGTVDVSANTVDAIVTLSSEEFHEFVSNARHEMILVYLSTLSDKELQRFYGYLDDAVSVQGESSARAEFENAMKKLEGAEISDESRARATLELPLAIAYGKTLYRNTLRFRSDIAKNYFGYESDDVFKFYEGNVTKVLYEEMKYIPTSFEQILEHYRDNAYNANDEGHQQFTEHLVSRFGYIIYAIYKLNFLSQLTNAAPDDNPLGWFVESFMQDKELDISGLEDKEPLSYYIGTLYDAIGNQDDDLYLAALIRVTVELFRYYPLHKEACEYAMVEMMKSVALKEVSVNNANSFISFFEVLPSFYDKLNFDTIYALKEKINHTLAEYKPQDNKVFDEEGVKPRMVLFNYLVDMEDLWIYEDKEAGSDE